MLYPQNPCVACLVDVGLVLLLHTYKALTRPRALYYKHYRGVRAFYYRSFKAVYTQTRLFVEARRELLGNI